MKSTGSPSWISRFAGLAPASVPAAAFVVDGAGIAYAGFRRQGRSLSLRESQSVALPEGTFGVGALGGPIGNGEALASAVELLIGQLATRPRAASIVLPDAWARGLVVELGALPERPDLRLDVLRFRLRKLVPFRVEELRIAAAPIRRVARQEDPIRALALFASEAVCAALESAFAARHVRIGQITNASLARLTALALDRRFAGLTALATVESGGFTVVFARDGEPLVWRQKSFSAELDDADQAQLLAAELRLTRTFLAERLGGETPAAVVLAAPKAVEAYWIAILEDGLERPVAPLASVFLPLAGEPQALPSDLLAALVGAVSREVA